MKFTSELVKCAKRIYKANKEKGLTNKRNWTSYMSEAFKQAIRYVKSCIKNAVAFFKLDGTEVTCRKVDFCSKFTSYPDFDKGRFFFWDLENGKMLTLHPHQLI